MEPHPLKQSLSQPCLNVVRCLTAFRTHPTPYPLLTLAFSPHLQGQILEKLFYIHCPPPHLKHFSNHITGSLFTPQLWQPCLNLTHIVQFGAVLSFSIFFTALTTCSSWNILLTWLLPPFALRIFSCLSSLSLSTCWAGSSPFSCPSDVNFPQPLSPAQPFPLIWPFPRQSRPLPGFCYHPYAADIPTVYV